MGNATVYSDKTKYAQVEAEYKLATSHANFLQTEYEKLFEELMVLEG